MAGSMRGKLVLDMLSPMGQGGSDVEDDADGGQMRR